MLSKRRVRISFLVLLLLFVAQVSSAQFYRQNDSIARIVTKGVVREKPTLAADSQKKKEGKKKRSEKVQPERKQRKKEAAKVSPKKGQIKYTGRKYRLGERIIMRGDSGNDVRSMARILVDKLYLDEKDIIYTADGGVLYDGEIIRALRLFQKVSGIYDDGIVWMSTVKALRKRK